jgi:hypothetical protein
MTFRGDMYGDGDITARTMHTGSITALNGAIDTLAVKALNIDDNAVTVPQIQTTSAPVSGTGSLIDAVSSLDLFVATTGLSGKAMYIECRWVGKTSYAGSGNYDVRLHCQQDGGADTQIDSVSSNGTQAAIPMMGGFLFTATGSVMHFYVHILWSGTSALTLTNRTLSVQVSKR